MTKSAIERLNFCCCSIQETNKSHLSMKAAQNY